METFSALLAICAGNSSVPGEFPAHRPVTWGFDVFFDLRPNKWFNREAGDLRRYRAHYDVIVMNVWDEVTCPTPDEWRTQGGTRVVNDHWIRDGVAIGVFLRLRCRYVDFHLEWTVSTWIYLNTSMNT